MKLFHQFFCFACVAVFSCFIILPQAGASEKTYTNSIGMEFVLIPSGSFMMGADKHMEGVHNAETPWHHVTISKAFYLGKFEVTQSQWVAVMGHNPSSLEGPSNPVDTVSWDDARNFVGKLNQMEGTDKYRLPTEAEWEYAARAGTENPYFFSDDTFGLDYYAWFDGNSGETIQPVGQKNANAWGLHDMLGNVWELVQDWYDENYYSQASPVDPQGPSSGEYRVGRGGSCSDNVGDCRTTNRGCFSPDFRSPHIGFRVLFEQ